MILIQIREHDCFPLRGCSSILVFRNSVPAISSPYLGKEDPFALGCLEFHLEALNPSFSGCSFQMSRHLMPARVRLRSARSSFYFCSDYDILYALLTISEY
jgi:hypothetical protein